MEKINEVVPSREKDLGGLIIRRVLPYMKRRMVGPFIFFDHMGPTVYEAGRGMNVRPHPHIHLSTVTYLFEGEIHHRDSLGYDQVIEPGAVNWMTAGRGIVHSERTPQTFKESGGKLHGIQCWVAVPEESENVDPSFVHHSKESLPEFEVNGVKLKLLLGSAYDHKSPVHVYSDLFYLEAKFVKGQSLTIPCDGREAAVYLVSGEAHIGGKNFEPLTMAIGQVGEDIVIEALEDSHIMILGGKPIGERFIYWNFVSSSKEELEQAKSDWSVGPGDKGSRFPKIPGDDQEFIPLPGSEKNPPGTAL